MVKTLLYTNKENGGRAPIHKLDTKFPYTYISLKGKEEAMQLKHTGLLEI